jgi:hypothetical protein
MSRLIYIETSIPSFYFDTLGYETPQLITPLELLAPEE